MSAERILGDVAVVGQHEGEWLAHVADEPTRDGGLQVALGARGRRHAVRDDRGLGDIGGGKDGAHARQLDRAPGVDREHARVGVARSQYDRLQHSRQPDIGHELPRSRDEPVASQAPMSNANH